jgi:IS5 family transposase
MQQLTLAHQADFQRYTKTTRREQFLEEMDAVMPWAELLALVAPYYSKGETGRKPVGLEIMLRVYFLQQWFALSDPAAEDALYESAVLRRFAGVDLGRTRRRAICSKSTICGGQMLDAVNHYLESRGIRISTGTIVDATIIHAPSRRPRTSRSSAIRRCIRRAKGISGTSG